MFYHDCRGYGADPEKEAELNAFIRILLESAKVFQVRRQQKLGRYRELLDKKFHGELGADEEEFLIRRRKGGLKLKKYQDGREQLEQDYYNLVLACSRCNLSKSDKWPTGDITQPHNGKDGFVAPAAPEFDGPLERNEKGYVVGKTPVGSSMCNILHLDIFS